MPPIISPSLPGISRRPAHGATAPPRTSGVLPSSGGGAGALSATDATDLPKIGLRERRYLLVTTFVLMDLVLASGAIFVGLVLRLWQRVQAGLEPAFEVTFWQSPLVPWSAAGGLFFVWLMLLFHSYEAENIYRMQVWFKNLVRVLVLWAVSLWSFIGLFQTGEFSPRVGIIYCIATLAITFLISRLVAFAVLLHPAHKHAADARVILVGWNNNVNALRDAMRSDPGRLQEIIGCVPMPGGKFDQRPPPEVAVLGDYSALPELAHRCRADTIILADVDCSSREIEQLVEFCQREFLQFRLIPRYFPALASGLQLESVSGIPLLGVGQLALDRTGNRFIKRTIDVVGAVSGLIIAAPVIAVFAAMVGWESPGPVIYRQRRTSRGGRVFTIYKIRSMRLDAEADSGAVWCTKDDQRRLRVGSLMRRYNIDELPQFWNVLKGDMSLVGPRPERPELIERFRYEIPNYNVRHEVRAGLTGWAQIQGLRGDTDLGQRIRADLYYLENWSVVMDLYCLIATFRNNKNAQ